MNAFAPHEPKTLKQRVTGSLHDYFRNAHYRAVLSKYKFVHVMNNGLHSAGIVEFVNTHFDPSEHAFVFPISTWATRQRLAHTPNVYEFDISCLDVSGPYKIIFHGLFQDEIVDYLDRAPKLLKRSHWFVWGGDLYNAPGDAKNSRVRRMFGGVITSFDQDVYTRKYGKNTFYDAAYPHEMTPAMIDRSAVDRVPGRVHIQINNSADETTLDMLDQLARFKDEDVKITTILSYISFRQADKRVEILRKGYDIFGDKFNPLMKFLSKPDYATHLASVDVYISNQDRQQGNGNAAFICGIGGKVYVKSDTPVYQKYEALGIRYFDTYDIPNLSLEELAARDPAERKESMDRVLERMSEPFKIQQWTQLFQDLEKRG
jgi:dTDP-N-acetylfucosamine:lipid II N-acetylfucosaminyltransferase